MYAANNLNQHVNSVSNALFRVLDVIMWITLSFLEPFNFCDYFVHLYVSASNSARLCGIALDQLNQAPLSDD